MRDTDEPRSGAFEASTTGFVPRSSRELIPWILFAVTTVCLVLTTLLLARRLRQEGERAVSESIARSGAEDRRSVAEVASANAEAKANALEAQVKSLTSERDALQAKVKQLEASKASGSTQKAPKKVPKKKVTRKKRRH